MLTLGVETTCDETSVAVLKDGRKILSNVVASSLNEHRRFGGVVPEIASRSHLEVILPCLDRALKKARVPLERLDLIAVAQGPGLMGSLLVGLSAAKTLALTLRKPLVGVDHVMAHGYSGFLSEPKLRFPFVGLVVSGGHTLLMYWERVLRCRVLGSTLDDAAGEAFDKVAKILGLGYPGGPEIDRLAQGQDPNLFKFTRPFLSKDSLDFSFSGIKTAVYYSVERLKKRKPLDLKTKKALCAGFQEAVCEVLTEKSVRAALKTGSRRIVVGGGVSANSRLRQMLKQAASRAGIRVIFPPPFLCQDNAAMIAALGTALFKEGRKDGLELSSYSEFREGLFASRNP
jgi:N6-L-threonylcarbamoyladenine synthase